MNKEGNFYEKIKILFINSFYIFFYTRLTDVRNKKLVDSVDIESEEDVLLQKIYIEIQMEK